MSIVHNSNVPHSIRSPATPPWDGQASGFVSIFAHSEGGEPIRVSFYEGTRITPDDKCATLYMTVDQARELQRQLGLAIGAVGGAA